MVTKPNSSFSLAIIRRTQSDYKPIFTEPKARSEETNSLGKNFSSESFKFIYEYRNFLFKSFGQFPGKSNIYCTDNTTIASELLLIDPIRMLFKNFS